MQESKTSEKRSQLPGAAVPQKVKFSLDDALVLPFPPWALMRTAAACQLLDQDGHSPLIIPRKRPICRDIRIQVGREQFLCGLGACHCPSSQAALFVCRAHFVPVSLAVPASGGEAEVVQMRGVQPYSESAVNMGKKSIRLLGFFSPYFENGKKK